MLQQQLKNKILVHVALAPLQNHFLLLGKACTIKATHRSLLSVSAMLGTLASSQAKLTGTQLASLTLLGSYFLYFYWQVIPCELSCTRMKMYGNFFNLYMAFSRRQNQCGIGSDVWTENGWVYDE